MESRPLPFADETWKTFGERTPPSEPDSGKFKNSIQAPGSSKSASENAMLKALLKQKTEEFLKRELELRTEILEVESQNERLKLERAADGARIKSLEAQLAGSRRLKSEVGTPPVRAPHIQPYGSQHKRERVPKEVITVVDSSDEETQDNATESTLRLSDAQTSPIPATYTEPGSGSPSYSQRPTRQPTSPAPEFSPGLSLPHRNLDPEVKEELIDVVIKTEGEPDQFKRVALFKSEGNPDIWNVDGFGLGPAIQLDQKYNRGFSRKVIGDAFGGSRVRCKNHWKTPTAGKTPLGVSLIYNRTWNNALPEDPGMHGIVFSDLKSSPIKPHPLNFFVGEGVNDWRLVGSYDCLRWGEIAPHHVQLLPSFVLDNRVNGILEKAWGKAWIEEINSALETTRKVKYTSDGIRAALEDGRVRIPFTILQCVGYPDAWFEKLLYYEKNPKPTESKPESGKRPGGKAQGSPKKRSKTGQNGMGRVKEERLSGDEPVKLDDESDDSDYVEKSRRIATLPTRTSPRNMQRLKSVEL
ncbi:hypothetical protein DFH06DRAFT_1079330 [Mycena polygramma]|nr:hypothetical protein DFH06DRAFT_1079330 [Mycena polygramma]